MTSGFFQDSDVKNKAADAPWMKSERDYVLDAYFAGGEGSNPSSIARKIGRNPKAVKRLLEQFTYNERDRVVVYVPFKRTSRKGRKLTQNEQAVIAAHKERGVNPQDTAKLLCRDVEEFTQHKAQEVTKAKDFRALAPTLDIIWAHRYLYFIYKKPILSDEAYDTLVKEEIEYGGGLKTFLKIKDVEVYPSFVRQLALYLHEKHTNYDGV